MNLPELILSLVETLIGLVAGVVDGDAEAIKTVKRILPKDSPLRSELAKLEADAKAKQKFTNTLS